MTITALSPSRIARAVPSETLPLSNVHVWIGPFGPVSVELATVTSLGIIAISGRPAGAPVQPHMSSGLGDSTTKDVSGTVAPLPGNTIGVAGRVADESRPRSTSSVPAECHFGVLGSTHRPNPADTRFGRRIPIVWNGPVIQRSMWLRAEALTELLTATLPLLPAISPPVV